ncbi:MAG TPA: protein DpdJ, partial [Herpetosiphonaceae bacterium]|nr:protein DpdJ [Herpetosiphonaceae bacterium]
DWLTGPRLVSDMRIQLQRRRYPRRDVPGEEVLSDVRALALTPLHAEAVEALLRNGSEELLRVASFQRAAVTEQLRALHERGDRAIVIGAGTGAGKTKAFYIPALAQVCTDIDSSHSTKVLAIYPRVELLKDQLAEALSEARKLGPLLMHHGRRSITIGAYYGDTPTSARSMLEPGYERQGSAWQRAASRDGWICPLLPCPNPGCGRGELTWSHQDVRAEADENAHGRYGRFARLRCDSCGTEVASDALLLTREHMVRQPPDLLFTTTEMLNRRMSRAREHSLFGIGTDSPPRLLLLDEIHTYDGLTGANVAYVLRRWRNARGYHPHRNLCIVGLSATLTAAEQFFSSLTGVRPHHVSYISPAEADLMEEGVEYNLVLKGDPVSGTSLLSTAVQTVMLLARVLEPSSGQGAGASRGAYGQKVFAFTDKLDVINRWYHIEQDAETQQVLSQHRERPPRIGEMEYGRRNEAGQVWWACERIGHDLRAPLILDLASSQYRGVRPNANLVIATATLEVGFNDPAVGAVVQHKAPRGMASFLQRKGRAGRTRAMRPWTVVVTSAYGRDRWAFQHAENLFSPVLPPLELPTENYYVRKIQASFALMDWLALSLRRQGHRSDIWRLLSSADCGRDAGMRAERAQLCRLLTDVLGGARLDDLTAHLQSALALTDDERALHTILWEEPRPLLLEVIPTMLRQIESEWQRIEGGKPVPWSDGISSSPLPDFVPANLFSALDLPELTLHIPDAPLSGPRRRGAPPTATGSLPMRDDQRQPLVQAMVEFAPGNVSKRYARSHLTQEAHWLQLPEEAQLSRGAVSLQHLKIELEPVPRRVAIDGIEHLVYRPRAYTLDIIPRKVKSTSSARLVWRSEFTSRGAEADADAESEPEATVLALAAGSPWRRFFPSIRAYRQANNSWVEVTRMAVSVQVSTRYEGGAEVSRLLRIEDGGQPAALGFSLYADALLFEVAPLDPWEILSGPHWSRLRQHLGPEYLLHCLRNDLRLIETGFSTFEIGWLWQLELSMIVAVAVSRSCDLPAAAAEVQRNRITLAERTLDVIFQRQEVDEEESEREGRLYRRIMEHLEEAGVQQALREHTSVLWSSPDSSLAAWLGEVYAATLGSALIEALTTLVPDINPDDLLMDVEPGAIWISEAASGGIGLITQIADAIAQRPRDFDLQLLDTLRHCEREQLAEQLSQVASLISDGDPGLTQAFAGVRTEADLPTHNATRRALARALEDRGLPATRELVVGLNTKYLRPNSGPDTDRLVALLAAHWTREQERLQSAIDLRVMAVAATRIPEIQEGIEQVLRRIGGPDAAVDENQVFNLLQSLLWLTCLDSCPSCIEGSQPFQSLVKPSRAVILTLLDQQRQRVVFGSAGWQEEVAARLEREGHAELVAEQVQLDELKRALLELLTVPLEAGYQLLYPMVERLTREGRAWAVELTVRELGFS